jgi:hypothetical protein
MERLKSNHERKTLELTFLIVHFTILVKFYQGKRQASK